MSYYRFCSMNLILHLLRLTTIITTNNSTPRKESENPSSSNPLKISSISRYKFT